LQLTPLVNPIGYRVEVFPAVAE